MGFNSVFRGLIEGADIVRFINTVIYCLTLFSLTASQMAIVTEQLSSTDALIGIETSHFTDKIYEITQVKI
jgi:hypothetical protein